MAGRSFGSVKCSGLKMSRRFSRLKVFCFMLLKKGGVGMARIFFFEKFFFESYRNMYNDNVCAMRF